MKKIFLLLIVVAIVFIVINKQRLYLRDPIAKITRDDIPVQGDTRVMINYSNDVLFEDFSGGKHRLYLLQHWNRVVSAPAQMQCLQGVVCLADADQATATPIAPGKRGVRADVKDAVSMSDQQVSFIDEDGAAVKIVLR